MKPFTVLAVGRPADGRRGTAARHQELIRAADMIQRLRPGNRKALQVQPNLAYVRIQFQYSQLAAARLLVRVRVVRIDEISSVLSDDVAA